MNSASLLTKIMTGILYFEFEENKGLDHLKRTAGFRPVLHIKGKGARPKVCSLPFMVE
jgi:hypothetical protein